MDQMVHHYGSDGKFTEDPIRSHNLHRASKANAPIELLRMNFETYKIIKDTF